MFIALEIFPNNYPHPIVSDLDTFKQNRFFVYTYSYI